MLLQTVKSGEPILIVRPSGPQRAYYPVMVTLALIGLIPVTMSVIELLGRVVPVSPILNGTLWGLYLVCGGLLFWDARWETSQLETTYVASRQVLCKISPGGRLRPGGKVEEWSWADFESVSSTRPHVLHFRGKLPLILRYTNEVRPTDVEVSAILTFAGVGEETRATGRA